MKITIYTTNECEFSKKEKAYLSSHGMLFEEKNLESNKEYLTEMLAVSNNFAGTPVTKVEKDDGSIVVLKGFTQEEFDKTLSAAPTVSAAVAPAAAVSPTLPTPQVYTAGQDISQPSTPTPPPSTPTPEPMTPPAEPVPNPIPSVPEPSPVVEPPKPAEPVTPPPTQVPQEAPKAADPHLTSILNDLQSMSAKSESPSTVASNSTTNATASTPSIPNPNF